MATIDYEHDTFRKRCLDRQSKGVSRHRTAYANQREYVEISLLTLTEPDESDPEYWQCRAKILAHDCDMRPPFPILSRMN